jgi:Predicted oxidoreductases (related to aryl-alcohol dehydrogenases)
MAVPGREMAAILAPAKRHKAVSWILRSGVPMAQVALAWVLGKRGASKVAQLDDAIAALAFQLSDEEIARLEAPYVPHAVTGFK